ncbi:MAG: hypothetical protein CM1200mP30_09910 [Pseudomonadota bacterium]|nr:MAG: hypothetical protein CM1200mP30_09910 [Pseudomonadota bacterium]
MNYLLLNLYLQKLKNKEVFGKEKKVFDIVRELQAEDVHFRSTEQLWIHFTWELQKPVPS